MGAGRADHDWADDIEDVHPAPPKNESRENNFSCVLVRALLYYNTSALKKLQGIKCGGRKEDLR
jgi:hypothetical protein